MEPRSRSKHCTKTSIVSKVPDYLIIILLVIVTFVVQNTNGYHQCVYGEKDMNLRDKPCPNNEGISGRLDYPIVNNNPTVEIVQISMTLFWCIFFIFNIIIISFYQHKYNYNSHYISQTIQSLLTKCEILFRTALFSYFSAQLTTLIIIKWIGRPAPNYYATNNDQSFPSQYATIVFNINTLLTLYLLHSILNIRSILYIQEKHQKSELLSADFEQYIHIKKLINPKCGDTYFGTYLWILTPVRYCMMLSLLFALVPLMFATYASCNQLTQYKYFYTDVIVAALIGFAFAAISYCIHYKQFYSDTI